MIPRISQAGRNATGKPRASGDDPIVAVMIFSLCKPRASGDDPSAPVSARTRVRRATSVNPARAGMIRGCRMVSRGGSRKPRASGDDPDGPTAAAKWLV